MLGLTRRREVLYTEADRLICTFIMALFGAFIGSTLTFLPTAFAAVAGALLFPYISTKDNARGDLFRTIALRIQAFAQDLWRIVNILDILPQSQLLLSQLFDAILFLDRKHNIKHKLLKLCNLLYAFLNNLLTATNTQQQPQEPTAPDDYDTTTQSHHFYPTTDANAPPTTDHLQQTRYYNSHSTYQRQTNPTTPHDYDTDQQSYTSK